MSKFNTIEEIVDDLMFQIPAESREEIRILDREDMGQFHHGAGTFIRNHYELWHTSPLTETWRTDEASHDIRDGVDYSLDHPDQVSMDILYAVWDRLHE